jgi:hypothetical protein
LAIPASMTALAVNADSTDFIATAILLLSSQLVRFPSPLLGEGLRALYRHAE